MNSLKNLLIVAILAAVGYGVYSSLQRNNVEPPPPPSVAESWSVGPKVELSKPGTSPGGPLALGSGTARSVEAVNSKLNGPSAPLVTPPAVDTSKNPLLSSTPIAPYTSSTSPTSAPAIPSVPANIAAPTTSPAAPSASLGMPLSPEAVAATPSPSTTSATPTQSLTDVASNLKPPAAVAAPASAAPPSPELLGRLAAFMDAIQKRLDEGKLADAQLALSELYNDPNIASLPADQTRQITDLLDRLAGTVVYSRQHHLEPAYVTRQGDTLDNLARKFNIPWQLLGRINGLMPPTAPNTDTATKDQPLPVGMELKVVRGPFDALVHLDKHELTLFVQNRYAGRFPVGVGRDQPKLEGTYIVRDKAMSPPYSGPDGVTINPNDPKNPLGSAWIGLTDRIGIHGTCDPQAIGRDDNRGTICVGDRDLQDLYGILSVGSRVTIVR